MLCWLLLAPALIALPAAPLRPACCRPGGAHHCDAIDMGIASDGSAILRATNLCPYPRTLATVAQHGAALPVSRRARVAPLSAPLKTFALHHIAHTFAAHESDRAPPAAC